MDKLSIALPAVALAFALGACGNDTTDRTTSIPRGVDPSATLQGEPSGRSAPPAPADRGPPPPGSNAAAPGTDAVAALAKQPNLAEGDGDAPVEPKLAERAQDAAVRAPDTASADAAKKAVLEQANAASSAAPATAQDTDSNAPRHGAMTPQQEAVQMPKAGQANNHSSTALEKDTSR